MIAYARGRPAGEFIVDPLHAAELPGGTEVYPIIRREDTRVRGANPWLAGVTAFSVKGIHDRYVEQMKVLHPKTEPVSLAHLKSAMQDFLGHDLVYHAKL